MMFDHPTQYGVICLKVEKKNRFFRPKIMIIFFSKSICLADEVRPPNQYWGSIHPIGAPKTALSCYIGRIHSYRNLALKFQSIPKNVYFHESVVFVAFVAFVAFWVLLTSFFRISQI